MNKKPIDMFCDFCNFGTYELIRGEEGAGQRKRLTQHLVIDAEEDSGDW